MTTLTSSDPEPPVGSIVRVLGDRWWHCPEGYWALMDRDGDPESWTKIAGNYGPAEVVRLGRDPVGGYEGPAVTIDQIVVCESCGIVDGALGDEVLAVAMAHRLWHQENAGGQADHAERSS